MAGCRSGTSRQEVPDELRNVRPRHAQVEHDAHGSYAMGEPAWVCGQPDERSKYRPFAVWKFVVHLHWLQWVRTYVVEVTSKLRVGFVLFLVFLGGTVAAALASSPLNWSQSLEPKVQIKANGDCWFTCVNAQVSPLHSIASAVVAKDESSEVSIVVNYSIGAFIIDWFAQKPLFSQNIGMHPGVDRFYWQNQDGSKTSLPVVKETAR